MCGSIAIVALDQHGPYKTPRSREDISRRLNNGLHEIRHRGPDSQGQWISPDGRVGPPH